MFERQDLPHRSLSNMVDCVAMSVGLWNRSKNEYCSMSGVWGIMECNELLVARVSGRRKVPGVVRLHVSKVLLDSLLTQE